MAGPTSGPGPGRAPADSRNQRQLRPRPWWLTFLIVFAANWILMRALVPKPSYVSVPYTFFKQQVQTGNVATVISEGDSIEGTFKEAITYPPPEPRATGVPAPAGGPAPRTATEFKTRRPAFADPGLETLLDQKGVVIKAVEETQPLWLSLLLGFGPTVLLIGGFIWFSQSAAGSGGGIFGLGRSRARRYVELRSKVTFDDVAGIEEAKDELIEVVDFLKNPTKYQRLGGSVPKGVLLVGAPGTGKTLLARAVAGEAGVPFFSMSASEFVEMIVGVGAARVRDLFKQAREAAPSIIFIDELDAVGRARGGGAALGGHDEREQTLNQILTEMDGFDSGVGVIVLAATNRGDVLDPALLRPGRFDRRVMVQRPDRQGRAAILKVHTKRMPLAQDVSLERIAAETAGLVGAELRNLVNEAALLAARKGESEVHAQDFSEAMEKITLGPARHMLLSAADRERTAYHESGHALLGLLVPGGDSVRRVTIVPRGMAMGVTYQLPTDDRTSYSQEYLRGRIISALGGRAAERLVYGLVSTGPENDLQQVTAIARQMVLRWGMSEKLGPLSFVEPQDAGLPAAFQRQPYSEATSELIDAEIKRIVDECEQEAQRLLSAHRDQLNALAAALLSAESLDEKEILKVTGLTRPQPAAAPTAAARPPSAAT
jgi:cell division protease FtsH